MTFLYFGPLAGLLAVGIPIVIHLLNKFQVKRVHWAAMRFLKDTIQRNQRRVKLEDLILLLLRCLIVVLLALAFARPVFYKSGGTATGGAVNAVVIIDDSMSMSCSLNGRTHFDQARDAALKIVDGLGSRSHIALYFVSDRVREAISPPSADLNEVRQAIRSAQVTYRASDLWPGIKLGVDQLARLDGPGKIFVISDGQQLAWRHRQEIVDLLAGEQGRIAFQNVPVGEPNEPNVAVSSIRLDDSIPVVDEPLRSSVAVTNWGTIPVSGIKVTLATDHAAPSAGTTLATIGSGQTETVSLITRFTDSGFHSLTASIPADHLTADDHRSIALEVLKDLHVLVVEGAGSAKPQNGDGFFLANALVPVPPAQRAGYYLKVKVGLPAELDNALGTYRTVFLSDVTQLTPAAVQALTSFVRQGGGLVVFPGNKISSDFYGNNAAWTALLPGRLGAPQNVGPHKVLAWQSRGYTHPLTSIWNDTQNGDLGSLEVSRYCPITLGASSGSTPDGPPPEVVANYADGQIAVASRQVGKGHVVLFGMAATPAWGNLPVNPDFVPLIYRLVGYTVRDPGLDAPLEPGSVFSETLPSDAAEKKFFVHEPGDSLEKRVTGEVELENDHALLRFSDTEVPGPYEVYLADATRPLASFTVQTNPEESNLATLPAEGIASALKAHAGSTRGTSSAPVRVTGELWLPVFAAALLATLLEMALVYFFSRNR